MITDKNKENLQYFLKNINNAHIPNKEFIESLGFIIDLSFDLKNKYELEYATKMGEASIDTRHFSQLELSELFYFLSNAWGNIKDLNPQFEQEWESKEENQQLYFLRRSLHSDINDELTNERKCQIFTNLGNLYSKCGRCIEAIEHYNMAIEIYPSFGMALGNKGLAIYYYAQMLADKCLINFFLNEARNILKNSIDNVDDPHSKNLFLDQLAQIKPYCSVGNKIDFNESNSNPCESTEEDQYKNWGYNQKLYLNPLNDVYNSFMAKSDNITLPPISATDHEPIKYHGFFNQIKIEFTTARYLFYKGLTDKVKHFSEKDILLINTLDYPEYGLNIELIKISYRVAYSVFDKIAFFINDYFNVGLEDNLVNFKTIWFKDRNRNKRHFTEKLNVKHNPGLKALFWISKDLYDEKSGYNEVIEPEAQELNKIRNHLEHKYLKLHRDIELYEPTLDFTYSEIIDSLAYSMKRVDFEKKSLKLLKLVRAALMYLVFSIKFEEQERVKSRIVILPNLQLYPIE